MVLNSSLQKERRRLGSRKREFVGRLWRELGVCQELPGVCDMFLVHIALLRVRQCGEGFAKRNPFPGS